MTSDEIRSLLDRFRQAWERRDLPALVACYAEDCEVVSPIFRTLTGRSQVEKSYADLAKAFETQQIKVEDIVIGDDGTAARRDCVAPAFEARRRGVRHVAIGQKD